MTHNATSTNSHQGCDTVAPDSRNELSEILNKHFSPVDLPDMVQAIRKVTYLGMYLTDVDLSQDDRFHFMLLESLANDLEGQVVD